MSYLLYITVHLDLFYRGLAECPTCHRTFESEALLKHLKTCRVREFKFTQVFVPEGDESTDDEHSDHPGQE